MNWLIHRTNAAGDCGVANLNEFTRRIDEGEALGATHLDLSGLGLDEIPEDVLRLKKLTTINAANNDIRVVPEGLVARLPKLQRLNLTGNPIEGVPNIRGLQLDWPAYLRVRGTISDANIRGIDISTGRDQNEPRDIEEGQNLFAHLSVLPNVRWLCIGLDLIRGDPALPLGVPPPPVNALLDRIGELKGLTELIVFGILLGRMPEGIRALKALEQLHLIVTGLSELPGYISGVPALAHTPIVDE